MAGAPLERRACRWRWDCWPWRSWSAASAGGAATQEISGAVVAPGQIEVQQNRQVVQHPDGGVVAEIAVARGRQGRGRRPAAPAGRRPVASDLAVTEGQLFEVMARRGRLEAERDGADEIAFDPELAAAAARTRNMPS